MSDVPNILEVFLKFSLAISFSLSFPYLATIFFPNSSTLVPAPLGTVSPRYADSLSISFRNMYLLIIEAQATERHLSSALVIKVIFWGLKMLSLM